MARTLKTTGPAANLVFCLGVEDDNTTIKEFVSADVDTNKIVNGCVAGTGTWKGVSVPYVVFDGNDLIEFAATHQPLISSPCTVMAVIIDGGAASVSTGLVAGSTSTYYPGIYGQSNNTWVMRSGADQGIVSHATAITGTQSYSVAFVSRNSTGSNLAYFALEANSITGTDGSATYNGERWNSVSIKRLGQVPLRGYLTGKVVLLAGFNTLLSQTDIAAIHADPFGTLFDVGSGGPSILLTQVERGRTLCRGLGRGIV